MTWEQYGRLGDDGDDMRVTTGGWEQYGRLGHNGDDMGTTQEVWG